MSPTDAATLRTANMVGLAVAFMLIGDFLFSANDVMGKWLAATYGAGQILLIRSLAALLVLSPAVHRAGWRQLVQVERPGIQVTRVLMSVLEVVCFYAAVAYMPIADVMTFYLAGPIYVAALSPWLLGERVSRRQWIAIAVGFVGVLIVLRPSPETLSGPAVISIVGSFAFALMVVQSRQLRATPDVTLVFWQTLGALVAGAVLSPFSWVTPTLFDFTLLSLLGVVALTAHLFINRSLKLAPASVVAPLQYTLLLWAILFGWLIFGDVPTAPMLIGGAIIVGAGLCLIERRRGAAPPTVLDATDA